MYRDQIRLWREEDVYVGIGYDLGQRGWLLLNPILLGKSNLKTNLFPQPNFLLDPHNPRDPKTPKTPKTSLLNLPLPQIPGRRLYPAGFHLWGLQVPVWLEGRPSAHQLRSALFFPYLKRVRSWNFEWGSNLF